ncbi:MAG TPA: hypothetical protein VLL97_11250 [Acidobacteriota bacterium]|nr:hypothetical protein [Acidobacteriota bacterium]
MEGSTMNPQSVDLPGFRAPEPVDVFLTDDGRKFLNQTRPWVRFLSIGFFVIAGFGILAGLMAFLLWLTGSMIGTENEGFGAIPGGGLMVALLYPLLAILYIPPGIFLSRYASAIKTLESARTAAALESALKYQKSFWRYTGIYAVAVLVIAAAAIALSITLGLLMFLNR